MNDLIKRMDALVAIRNLYPAKPKIDFMDTISNWRQKNRQYMECERAIEELPSAELQPTCNQLATSCNQLATDCISRQDAIALMCKALHYNYEEGYAVAQMLELPSAQPEPRWIPFTERWPKAFEYCLFTTVTGEVVYHNWDGAVSKYTAWMTLPEPWKGGEDECMDV